MIISQITTPDDHKFMCEWTDDQIELLSLEQLSERAIFANVEAARAYKPE